MLLALRGRALLQRGSLALGAWARLWRATLRWGSLLSRGPRGLLGGLAAQGQGPWGRRLAVGAPAGGGIPLPLPGQGLGHLVDHELHDELLVLILVVPDERHGGAHHLDDVIPPVLAMQRFHCTDVQSPKDLRARVHPQLVPVRHGNLLKHRGAGVGLPVS